MDVQIAIDIALALLGLLGGWVLRFLHGELKMLQVADIALAIKVQNIEVLVAGEYVKRSQLERMEEALFAKLDRIEELVSRKADKL